MLVGVLDHVPICGFMSADSTPTSAMGMTSSVDEPEWSPSCAMAQIGNINHHGPSSKFRGFGRRSYKVTWLHQTLGVE